VGDGISGAITICSTPS